MDLAKQQWHLAGARDSAVQRLRDLTIAIAIASAAAVGLVAWVSAATIPGGTATNGLPGTTATDDSGQPSYSIDQGFGQTAPGGGQPGSGVAVSGGSK